MKRLIWIVAALVLVAGGSWVATATPAPRYRVATAEVGDVAQTVTVTGAVDHVNRADVAFGTDGTLASLTVAPGTVVTAGQELGKLDTASLAAAVSRASAAVTAAEAAQAEDEAAQEAAADAADEVAAARSAAVQALTAASAAVDAQAAACADPASAACTEAVAATRSAQEAVQEAQSALQAAMDRSAGPDAPDAATSVAEASAQLVEAQQALAGATLVSPIAGTVGAVSAAVGGAVTAGTPVVTVIGEGAAEVSATVPVEQLEELAVGQEATVTPVGTTAAVPGTVTAVGTLPTPSTEAVTYPVTITVPSPPPSMAAGSTATATVTVATATSVLTVPTSAVRQGTVTVLTGEETTPTPVTVGAVGAARTEIREGLAEGAVVVLADLDTPVPTNDQQPGPGGFVGGGGGPVRMMRPNG